MLNLLCECVGSNVTRPVFVTSFSAEKNELSQWRAYGGSSGSFALGFNSERLVAAIAKNTDMRFNLYKCIYDEAHSASLCQQFVESLLQEFRGQRLALRRAESAPVLAKLREKGLGWKEQLLPKHPMVEAINYALNQWAELNLFCSDGAVPIDNNVSEREMRRIILNRKNSLFVGNSRGGRTA
jgi:hypothetical protein